MSDWVSFNFTGPSATHTLLGDRQMRGSIFPTEPSQSETSRAVDRRAKAKYQAKLLKAKVAKQMEDVQRWGLP